MNSRVQKIYFEYLAKLILETFVPSDYINLELKDKPDLRMGDSIGIEVTRVLIDGEGQASGIFEHVRDNNIDSIDNRYLTTLDRIDYYLLQKNGEIIGYGPTNAMVVDSSPLNNSFSNKLRKTYDMSSVDIFMFSPMREWFEKDCIEEFMVWTNINGGDAFRRIMVYEYPCLYLYESKQLRVINLDHDKCLQCIMEAKQYAVAQG